MTIGRKKLIACSGIANTFEWYDYALFGSFAELIGRKFFPSSDPTSSMLNAFLVFAVGYLMRPIGGIFFGILGDKFGRRFALSASVICMSVPTGIIGLLPTYETFGMKASVLMVLMRMLQGLSMGGALTGSISFLIEHTEPKNRGFVGSVPMASICIGILLGTVVSYSIRNLLSYDNFELWGWRIPFIFGIFILFVGLYIRRYTEETPLFNEMQKRGEIAESPLKEVLAKHWFEMLNSVLINSTGSVLFYFQAIYVPNYLKFERHFDQRLVDELNLVCYGIMAIICVIAGKVSDVLGARKYVFLFAIFGILLSIQTINFNFSVAGWETIIFSQLVLAIFAAFYIGPEPALQAEYYPTEVRSTALSVSYNLATSLFGGTAPYVIGYLYSKSGSLYGCGYYIIITSCMSLLGLYFYKTKYQYSSQINEGLSNHEI